MATLKNISTYDLQKELEKRQNLTIDTSIITGIIENYKMGLIYADEALSQLKDYSSKELKKLD